MGCSHPIEDTWGHITCHFFFKEYIFLNGRFEDAFSPIIVKIFWFPDKIGQNSVYIFVIVVFIHIQRSYKCMQSLDNGYFIFNV